MFNHRFHADALRSAFPVSRAGITGGGTSRPRAARLFADVLGLPVDVPRAAEVGALGAALVAGVGVGVHATLDDAALRACRVSARHEPDPANHAALGERFARYVALAEAILPLSSGRDRHDPAPGPPGPAASPRQRRMPRVPRYSDISGQPRSYRC